MSSNIIPSSVGIQSSWMQQDTQIPSPPPPTLGPASDSTVPADMPPGIKRYLGIKTEDLLPASIDNALPPEVLCEILSHMNPQELLSCCLISRRLCDVAKHVFSQKDCMTHFNFVKGIYTWQKLLSSGTQVYSAIFHGNRLIIASNSDQGIEIFDLHGDNSPKTLGKKRSFPALSPSGNYLASICRPDPSIMIWDLKTGTCIKTLEADPTTVDDPANISGISLVFGTNDNTLFSSSYGQNVQKWNLQEETNELVCEADDIGSIAGILRSPNGLYTLISSPFDGIVKIYDLQSNTYVNTPQFERVTFTDYLPIVIHPNGKSFLLSWGGKMITHWDLESGKSTIDVSHPDTNITCFDISPDGKYLIVSYNNRQIMIWDTEKKTCIQSFETPGICDFLKMSPDGKQFIIIHGSTGIHDSYNQILVYNFNAPHQDVFAEIAHQFREFKDDNTYLDSLSLSEAKKKFSNMPQHAREQIYAKLYTILNPGQTGSAEDAFCNVNGQSSTWKQKAQAIEEYLKDNASK